MGIQEQSGRTRLNYVPMPNNQMSVDARISSVNGLQPKEQGSSGDEHAPKVRKPYTITKQRERWTEEEHKMFLEALQLYGRAWRRIEEHIGTKTAVQIRSHAQKFFSKQVVRESAANSTGDVKPIEIPPPRPKRKPVHPYPRKMGNSSSRGNLSLSKLERSTSPILFASEQENGSPTSVLSAVGSDTLGSLFSNLPNSCTSPVTSAAGSNEQETSVEEENRPPSPGQTTAGLETQHQSTMVRQTTAGLTTQQQSTMELDLGYEGHVSSKEASSAEAQVPCIKLFGRTVLVTDSHKPPSSSIGNTVPFSKLLPPVGIESQDRCAHVDSGSAAQPLVQGAMHGDFLLGPGKSTWSPWSEGMLPMFYSLPSSYGDPMDPVEAGIIPLPWWALCANLPFTFTYQQNIRSRQVGCQPCADTSNDIEMQKECSWTGSNTYSATERWHAASSQSGEPCRDMANDSPALSNQRASSNKYVRGFMPYKRCLVEREVQHSKELNDDGEGRTIGLCL